VGLVKIRHGRG